MRRLISEITRGMRGLLSSRNGVMSLITLGVAAALCWFDKIDGVGFSAAAALITSIYGYTRARFAPGGTDAV